MLFDKFKFQKIVYFKLSSPHLAVIFKTFKKFVLHSKVVFSIVIILSKSMRNYFSFSTFGNIWTKLRNKLEAKKARKLAKIKRFLKKNVEEGESEEVVALL